MKKELLLSLLGGCLLVTPTIHSQESLDSTILVKHGMSMADFNVPGLQVDNEIKRLVEYYLTKGFPTEDQLQQMSWKLQRNNLISKAPKDGCFYGIGDKRNTYVPFGMSETECAECENSGGTIKTNQSYVWGLTNDADNIFWGTNFNYVCTGRVEIMLKSQVPMDGINSYANECIVCEYLDAANGYDENNLNKDWRPPRIYRFDKKSGKTKDITPDTNTDPNINKAFGLRSAGTYKNFSVIAGPNSQDHISMYWYDNSSDFNDDSNGYIGSWTMKHLPGYENKVPFNIRRWIVANDELYCAIEYVEKGTTLQKGAILRWKREVPFDLAQDGGDPSPYFEVVGWTAGGAGDICLMNDRFYVSTMPSMTICQGPLMNGKVLPKVNDENDTPWPSVFSYMNYDPDPICKSAVAGGALHAYKGKLYFGTMHVPMGFAIYATKYYGVDAVKEDPSLLLKALLGTQRATALFRLSENPDGTTETELLYGEEELPAFNFRTKEWEIKPTNMVPLFGKSGFNNAWNNYTWSMCEINDKLYIGTQDWTNMWVPMLKIDIPLPDAIWDFAAKILKETNLSGYDIMCFEDHENAAKIVTTNGFGVSSSYGARNMVFDGKKLYIGSASGHNLAETGGWEIVEVTDELPLMRPEIRWERNRDVAYGENWKEDLPKAKAKQGIFDVQGTFDYSINYMPLAKIEKLEPGKYKIRANFKPELNNLYRPEASVADLMVKKAQLNVIGEDIEIMIGEQLHDSLSYTLDGFVYNENQTVLEELPVVSVPTDLNEPGVYDIEIKGGKSELYDFNYINGKLIIKVVSGMAENQVEKTKLYPIPFKDNITLESQLDINYVEVTDLSGNVMVRINNPASSLDLSELNNGIYLMVIDTEEGRIIRKVTKK